MTAVWRPLQAGETDHERLWSVVGAAAIAMGILLLHLVGALPVACAFKAVTGWPCPTCGATRAATALAGGHLFGAIRQNPLFTLIVLAWAAYIPYGLWAGWADRPRLRVQCSRRDRAVWRMIAIAVIASNWVFLVVDGR
jgi:Protein of unknown function (DUF2752)